MIPNVFILTALLGVTFLFPVISYCRPAEYLSPREAEEKPVPTAPPPRDAKAYSFYSGIVTNVDRSSIAVQGINDYAIVSNELKVGYKLDERLISRVFTSFSGEPLTLMIHGRKLSIARAELTREKLTATAPDGTVTLFRRVDESPRRFEVSDWLASGGFPPGPPGGKYPLSEVKVGDWVKLQIKQYRKRYNICHGLIIERRPGGLVPPAYDERPDSRTKHHERMQAQQDWEERGMPIPDKYHWGGPYPGIAPMPHEPILRIPTPAP